MVWCPFSLWGQLPVFRGFQCNQQTSGWGISRQHGGHTGRLCCAWQLHYWAAAAQSRVRGDIGSSGASECRRSWSFYNWEVEHFYLHVPKSTFDNHWTRPHLWRFTQFLLNTFMFKMPEWSWEISLHMNTRSLHKSSFKLDWSIILLQYQNLVPCLFPVRNLSSYVSPYHWYIHICIIDDISFQHL